MVDERIEIHVRCDTQHEFDIAKLKLTDYGYECTETDMQYSLLAVKHLTLNSDEI